MKSPIGTKSSLVGLSGDPYTIYMNAERLLEQNPNSPDAYIYEMQMENALLQMRHPNYTGRRPDWLEAEMSGYPRLPGVYDRGMEPDIMPDMRGGIVRTMGGGVSPESAIRSKYGSIPFGAEVSSGKVYF